MQHENVEFMMFMELLTVNVYQPLEKDFWQTLCANCIRVRRFSTEFIPVPCHGPNIWKAAATSASEERFANVARVMDLR